MRTKISYQIEKLEKLLGTKLNVLNPTDKATLVPLYSGKPVFDVFLLRGDLYLSKNEFTHIILNKSDYL